MKWTLLLALLVACAPSGVAPPAPPASGPQGNITVFLVAENRETTMAEALAEFDELHCVDEANAGQVGIFDLSRHRVLCFHSTEEVDAYLAEHALTPQVPGGPPPGD